MKPIHLALLVSSLFLFPCDAFAGSTPETRVLMVGDSWAGGMWNQRTLRDVFAANGRADIVEEGSVTAIGGTKLSDWVQPIFLQSLADELDAHPTVDTVHLTISGNDYLAGQQGGGWYVGISPTALDGLLDRLQGDMTTLMDHILAQDPDLEVVLNLYDYPNFVDSLDSGGCMISWNRLGQPTPRQINEALVLLQDSLKSLVDARPRVSWVNHVGLMQFTYGFVGDNIPPGTLLPPGDLDRPSPIEAMTGQQDCIHLNPDGYFAVGQNLWRGFYERRFNGIFVDGFESGDVAGWSASTP